MLDEILVPKFQNEDAKLYDIVKTAIVPDYERLKARKPNNYQSTTHQELKSYLENSKVGSKTEYIDKLETLVSASNGEKIGIIVCGSPLSGKSTLINIAA